MMLHAFFIGIAAAAAALLFPSGRNLEYEHVTLAAGLVAICWPLVAILCPSRISSPAQWVGTVAGLFSGLALPGLVMFAAKICPCSEVGYGQWLLVQAFPSCLLAATAGNIAVIMINRNRKSERHFRTKRHGTDAHYHWRPTLLWLGAVAVSLISLAATLWFMPQKRSVHILLGFLHGPIYDERIWLHRDILLARAGHAFLFAAIGLATCTWRKGSLKLSSRTLIASLGCGWIITTILIWESPVIGHGSRLLQSQFPKRIDSPGWHLFHDMDDLDATRLAAEAAFHIGDLKKILGPIDYPTVDIYAYPDAHSKKLWFGGGATDVTDVVTPGVHITVGGRRSAHGNSLPNPRPVPHPTLRHELVHALASRIAFHGLGFHPNMAITEGLAVALAPDANIFNVMSLDDGAAELLESGRITNPERLFSPWTFWLESGPRAYTVAGSLIGWLAKSPRFHGMATVIKLYAGKSWHESTGEESASLIAEWQKEIAATPSGKAQNLGKKIRASTLFRSSGIAKAACPHSFADMMANNPDENYLEFMARVSGDPGYHVMVLRKKAHAVFIAKDRAAAAGLGQQILNELNPPNDQEAAWPPRNEEDIELRILALDLLAFGESKFAAKPDLADLAAFHDSHPLPVHLARQILVRERLGQILPSSVAASWRWYLAGWSALPPDAIGTKESPGNSPWLLDYLRLRSWVRIGLPAGINLQLTDFINKKLDETLLSREPAFAFEWYRTLAELAENDAPAAINPMAHALWLKAAASSQSRHNNQTVRDQMEQNARRTGAAYVP